MIKEIDQYIIDNSNGDIEQIVFNKEEPYIMDLTLYNYGLKNNRKTNYRLY